ncbi:MAG: PAS domain-containing sensor histidine kinase [Verrucomicrobiae bacterium]|nr:PAS domain-containing sensor histidine kinase [Verrucomicrobiae bacterium]
MEASSVTAFAPPGRASSDEVRRLRQCLLNAPLLGKMLNLVPEILLVLNKERQIVFANQAAMDFLGKRDVEEICGMRPGEAFNCVHACEKDAGCGITEFCRVCGAVNAILNSQKGKVDVQECRMVRRDGLDTLDLKVWAAPVEINGETFTLFAITDISAEKRRKVLERVFFHDILNTAGGLQGFASLLKTSDPSKAAEIVDVIYEISGRLVEEIKAQKELNAAEANELEVFWEEVNSSSVLKNTHDLFFKHDLCKGKKLRIDEREANIRWESDRTLISRILDNMVKNALEASAPGQTVTIGCQRIPEGVEFWVHNAAFMPPDVQLQVFQRSFTTKGSGRGLGAYGMKLLGERYLKGRVSFVSTEKDGTTFKAAFPLRVNK